MLYSNKKNVKNTIKEICSEPKVLTVHNENFTFLIHKRDKQLDMMIKEISELKKEIKDYKEKDTKDYSYSPQEILVLSYSADFRKDYKILIESGYMRRKDDGFLEWLKTKQSLAEYFGSQEQHGPWPHIENLFQQKGLNHILSVATNKSKDYKKLVTLLSKKEKFTV